MIVASQLDHLDSLADLIHVDGEIGQPRLRQSCDHLHVMLDRSAHLLVLFVVHGSASEVAEQLGRLQIPVESLLADSLDELEQLLESARIDAKLDAFVLLPDVEQVDARNLIDRLPIDQTLFSDAISDFPSNAVDDLEPLPAEAFERLRDLLFPKRQWKRVQLVRDEGRLARHERRIQLQKTWLDAGWGLSAGTTLIEGGPGSGKSLMLVSRAAWLANALSLGSILLVTWNRSLAAVLKHWLRKFAVSSTCIDVITLADFLKRHHIELDLADPADADARCKQLLERKSVTRCYDAILVDEAQDLGGILVELLKRFVIKDRGGFTLAMDSSQNVRCRPRIDRSQLPSPVELISLSECYRSTAAIQQFCYAFAGYKLPDSCGLPEEDDEKVRLVWAENHDECIAMIVCEANRLLQDVGLRPEEILVVAFDGRLRRKAMHALEESGLTVTSPGKQAAQSAICVASPEVAKGHEASCVFVVGWDTAESDSVSEASRRFVAASRAADILYVVYASQEIGGLVEKADSLVVKQLWPDDFDSPNKM